jgi:cytochrome c1
MGKFCDSDLAMIFAYVNSLPPVDNVLPKSELGPLGRAMLVAGLLPPEMIPAEMIDHSAPSCFESPADGTLEFGEYLASFCSACHGQDFSGSPNPLGEEFTQSPMNLTPGGVMGDWSEAEFINTLRTGIAPDDYKLDPEEMPWQTIAKATDSQLKALWRYLQILPPVETEHR